MAQVEPCLERMFIFCCFCPLLGPPGFNCWFSFAPVFQWVARHPGDLQVSVATCFSRVLISVSSEYVFICDLFVSRDDPLMS